MDVLIISYTAPIISLSMNFSSQELGIVFSSGVLGMAIGALILAPLADKIGRRKIILISIIIISLSVIITALSSSLYEVVILRFLSGLGIGSMLATTVSMVSEYTPSKSKEFWISFILAGYPIGAILAGFLSNFILVSYNWQSVFLVFGLISSLFIPIVYFLLPESILFLKNNNQNSLQKINSILKSLNHSKIKVLPNKSKIKKSIPLSNLFSQKFIYLTIKLWTAFFFSFMCLYFLISWIPKLVSDFGLSMELGIYSGVVFNIGAFFGILTQGFFSSLFGLRKTIFAFLLLTALLMLNMNFFLGSNIILIVFGVLGFFIQGGFVGLYALAARIYPTEFRNTGIGWSIGAGRLGAVIGPLAAGFLLSLGLGISENFKIFAIPAIISSFFTLKIYLRN